MHSTVLHAPKCKRKFKLLTRYVTECAECIVVNKAGIREDWTQAPSGSAGQSTQEAESGPNADRQTDSNY